jgi:hypothetical protein
MEWIINNAVGIAGTVVGSFIAYHVYFLSKKLDISDRLTHREQIRTAAAPILKSMESRGSARKVELINIKKYDSHYPGNNELNRDGYTYLGAELKAHRHDGIEFFCAMVKSVYKKSDGSYALTTEKEDQPEEFRVYPVGLIPYHWIKYVEADGDESAWRPQFFTAFKGKDKSPYQKISYYKESDTYHEGSDPIDWKYRLFDIKA